MASVGGACCVVRRRDDRRRTRGLRWTKIMHSCVCDVETNSGIIRKVNRYSPWSLLVIPLSFRPKNGRFKGKARFSRNNLCSEKQRKSFNVLGIKNLK